MKRGKECFSCRLIFKRRTSLLPLSFFSLSFLPLHHVPTNFVDSLAQHHLSSFQHPLQVLRQHRLEYPHPKMDTPRRSPRRLPAIHIRDIPYQSDPRLRILPIPFPSSLPPSNVDTSRSFASRIINDPRGHLVLPANSAHLSVVMNPVSGPSTNNVPPVLNSFLYNSTHPDAWDDRPSLPPVGSMLNHGQPPPPKRSPTDWVDERNGKKRRFDQSSVPSVGSLLNLEPPPYSSTMRRIEDWVDETNAEKRHLDQGNGQERSPSISSMPNQGQPPSFSPTKKRAADLVDKRNEEKRRLDQERGQARNPSISSMLNQKQPPPSSSWKRPAEVQVNETNAKKRLLGNGQGRKLVLQSSTSSGVTLPASKGPEKSKSKASTRGGRAAATRGRRQAMMQPTPGHTVQ
jgi:hypothetical protein